MELLEAIQTRHSVRAFKSTPVPDDVIHQILKAASNSPSYMNTQPWEVAVVTGTKRDELSRQLYELASSGVEPHPDIPLPKGWPPGLAQRAESHNMKRLQLLGISPDDEPKKRELLLANFKFTVHHVCYSFSWIKRSARGRYSIWVYSHRVSY